VGEVATREPERQRQSTALRQVTALAGAGIQFAVTAALCTAAGWWLDGRLGSSPWLLMAGGIVGAVGAFYRLYRTLIDVAADGDEPVKEE
jgi:F0F1-type ATP synthase assembly protein I